MDYRWLDAYMELDQDEDQDPPGWSEGPGYTS